MILLQSLETVRPALLLSGVPTQSFILRGASPKVPEHGRTTPVAYELASDTCYRLGVVTSDVQSVLSTLKEYLAFDGTIKVHHFAIATFYAPSDLSGSGGLRREQIWSTPYFFGHPHRDTVFVVTDNS